MSEEFKEQAAKLKVFPKGQVVIPVSLRKKFNIVIGDRIDVLTSKNGILLRPSPITEEAKTATGSLFGIFKKYALKKKKLTKNDIQKATRNGFTQGQAK